LVLFVAAPRGDDCEVKNVRYFSQTTLLVMKTIFLETQLGFPNSWVDILQQGRFRTNA